ncbi:MAG TPA: type 1 glutamine amidotransferase domain-containing protein [Pantanalinema sp.]
MLIPLPDHDFDVTEVSIPWSRFTEQGYETVFSTEHGRVAAADPLLISGVIFGQLGAKPEAVACYDRMRQTTAFLHPIRYRDIDPSQFDALLLPGGHASGMKQYLENSVLREKVLGFFQANKPVAAICHGLIVLARTLDPTTGRSVLYGRQVTGLLKSLERTGFYLTFWKLGGYYRTYPAYVEDEIKDSLQAPSDFRKGKAPWIPFVVRDRNLITARWPKDANCFAQEVIRMLESI